jgi:hypothetical protein
LTRVLADNASVFDMTGISEESADFPAGAKPIINGPTIINRLSKLTFTIENADASGLIKIFDINGRMIKNLGSRTVNAPITWSLDDESGNRAAAGIYFVRYESGKTAAIHKLVITD